MGTRLGDIPDELVIAATTAAAGRILPTRRTIAATLDWLCEHPAEAARLLGTRTPTSWDV